MTRPPRRPAPPPPGRATLHPRNRHQGRYDLARLTAHSPELSAHLVTTPAGEASVDFADPDAVRALNRALLKADYGVAYWDLPDGYLCPPIPGRADYVHGLADLLAGDNAGVVPRGRAVRALDIGTGANCIYPLLGHAEYGWQFTGSEVDATALAVARAIVQSNPGLSAAIELRHQSDRDRVFAGVVRPGETFDMSLCNPPFHASAAEAARGSQRKWRNLGRGQPARQAPALNFGGQAAELWCPGGEAAFVRRMIDESAAVATGVMWFSSLLSKAENLHGVQAQLGKAGARDVRVVAMGQGSKRSRFVAWTFLDAAQRQAWRRGERTG